MQNTEKIEQNKPIQEERIKVLLVDDQAIVAASVKQMLSKEQNIDFYYCQDPTKALETALEVLPTIILQDLIMPDIDGLTLVKFFRGHPKLRDIPVIVLTSKEDAETKRDLFNAGATDYLVKPPNSLEFIARIQSHSKGFINLLQRNENYEKLLRSQQALASELAKAGDYCISLLPEPIKDGDIKTEWKFVPSTQLGGDSFGYHWIDNDHFAMYLLDVCGHGVGSALLSVSALNALRTQTLPNTDFRDPVMVLSALNASFQMSDHRDMYFTMWYGVYNKVTSELKYGSAGHPGALFLNNENEAFPLETPNFIIGGLPDFPFTGNSIFVKHPSKLFIFSDGVYEIAINSERMWSLDELYAFLREQSLKKETVIDNLHKYVQKIGGQTILEDDFSILEIDFE